MKVNWYTNIFGKGSAAIVSRNLFNHRNDDSIKIFDICEGQNSDRFFKNSKFRSHITSDNKADVKIRFGRKQSIEDDTYYKFDDNCQRILYLSLPFSLCFENINSKNIWNYYDKIFTCSNFVKESLANIIKYPEKIHVLNHGIDTKTFYPLHFEKNQDEVFTFLNVSIPYVHTKGLDILFESYISEFSEYDNVQLILKNRYGVSKEIQKIIYQLKKKYKSNPKIVLDNSFSSEQEMNLIYNQCDCYIQLSRLEAFGLPVLEAMAVGKEVICTNGLGMNDFCTNNNVHLVEGVKKYDTRRINRELGLEEVEYYFEPNIEATRVIMRNVFNNNLKIKNYSIKDWAEVNIDLDKLFF